jgi:hypothetical protein
VRRRSWFAVTAVAAASLAVGAGMALAATPKAATGSKVKPITLRCSMSLTTTPPRGSASVDQPPAQGTQYGPNNCPTNSFGGGIMEDSFTVPDSGDTVGTYKQYFGAGTIKGAFDLTPNEGAPISGANFASQSWTGTVTVTGGTGTYKGIKGKKNSGVMNCTSPDSVHLTCTEHVKVVMPPAA